VAVKRSTNLEPREGFCKASVQTAWCGECCRWHCWRRPPAVCWPKREICTARMARRRSPLLNRCARSGAFSSYTIPRCSPAPTCQATSHPAPAANPAWRVVCKLQAASVPSEVHHAWRGPRPVYAEHAFQFPRLASYLVGSRLPACTCSVQRALRASCARPCEHMHGLWSFVALFPSLFTRSSPVCW